MIDCPHAARCSGCTRLSQPYDAQLADKTREAARHFERYVELRGVTIEPCRPAAPIVGYRTRAKWVIAGGKIGLFAKGGGHDVVDLPGCLVVPGSFLAVAASLRAVLADGGAAGSLVGVDIRGAIDGNAERLLVTLVHDRSLVDAASALAPVAARLMHDVPAVVGVARAARDAGSPRFFGGTPSPLMGDAQVRDGGHTATFGGFVQAHRGQANEIHADVVSVLRSSGAKTALDVFGGAGAIALELARAGADVELVELVASAAKVASATARREGLTLTTTVGDAEALVGDLRPRDLVVVDPPRRGLSPELRVAIARIAQKAIVYVSCDPATLSRDLAHLARLGFRASTARPLDMIPLTDEIETVVALVPATPSDLVVLYEDDALIVIDKPPHIATTQSPSLLDRVRALSPRAVAIGALPPQASGVALFAKDPAFAPSLRAKLGDTRYTAIVRGVPRGRGALRRDAGRVVLSYVRVGVVGGHGAIGITAAPSDKHGVLPALAKIGHPALGDTRDGHAPTNAFFFATAALDRGFLHCSSVSWGGRTFDSPLAADLASTRERLEFRSGTEID